MVAHTRGIRPEAVDYLVAKGATGTVTTWARDQSQLSAQASDDNPTHKAARYARPFTL